VSWHINNYMLHSDLHKYITHALSCNAEKRHLTHVFITGIWYNTNKRRKVVL